MLLHVNLTAETPLSFRTGRNPARSETLPYIPGTSLLGGLAQAHHELRRDPDEFAAFFLQEQLYFGNCYPATFRASQLQGDARPVLPIPSTGRSCKRFGGFKFNADQEEHGGAGVTDTLIPLALFALRARFSHELAFSSCLCPKTCRPPEWAAELPVLGPFAHSTTTLRDTRTCLHWLSRQRTPSVASGPSSPAQATHSRP